jgi:hypothetical protein
MTKDAINETKMEESNAQSKGTSATFAVHLKKVASSDALGAAVESIDGMASLLIKSLKNEGLIPSWNSQHVSESQELQVHVGDVIVEVNGITGSAPKMLEAFQDLEIFLIISRGKALPSMAQPNQDAEAEPD